MVRRSGWRHRHCMGIVYSPPASFLICRNQLRCTGGVTGVSSFFHQHQITCWVARIDLMEATTPGSGHCKTPCSTSQEVCRWACRISRPAVAFLHQQCPLLESLLFPSSGHRTTALGFMSWHSQCPQRIQVFISGIMRGQNA